MRGETKTVKATEYIQLMFQGRSRSQLVMASDQKKYVVKLIGNPQGSRILANECVTAALAKALGAPCVPSAIVEVDDDVLSQIDRRMKHTLPGEHITFRPGLQFGSEYLGVIWPFPSDEPVKIFTSTLERLRKTSNVSTWPNSIVLNTLAQNEDTRETHVLVATDAVSGESRYWLIDHGHCLGVDRGWQTLSVDSMVLRWPLYQELVVGGEPFKDAFERLNALTPAFMTEMLASLPLGEWGVSADDQRALVRYVVEAKARVVDLISSSRSRFPNWSPA